MVRTSTSEIVERLIRLEERVENLTNEVSDLKGQFKGYMAKILYALLIVCGALAGVNLIKP